MSEMAERLPVAILCGGRGTRLVGHVEDVPKALVEIGGRPILWHIMKLYAFHGLTDFILCLGYQSEKIEQYVGAPRNGFERGWRVTCLPTGLDTHTGGRLKQVEPLITVPRFLATYGDGLSNIDVRDLLRFHDEKGRLATMSCVRPMSPFGIAHLDRADRVIGFEEKPVLDHWVNGGFFVFEQGVFRYLTDNAVLEREALPRLAEERQLSAYRHHGFWKCMDTYKDTLVLNQLWKTGEVPWACWHQDRRPSPKRGAVAVSS
jgi:glucose-1-phosphate cytidylyltransferase